MHMCTYRKLPSYRQLYSCTDAAATLFFFKIKIHVKDFIIFKKVHACSLAARVDLYTGNNAFAAAMMIASINRSRSRGLERDIDRNAHAISAVVRSYTNSGGHIKC